MLKVTCAIIQHEGKTLAVKRSAVMQLPLKWEFPGGKIEKGENEEDCIIREVKEELNLDIAILRKLNSSVHHYPHITIELIPFIAKQTGGSICLKEHAEFNYLTKNELLSLDWSEADFPIVKEYIAQ